MQQSVNRVSRPLLVEISQYRTNEITPSTDAGQASALAFVFAPAQWLVTHVREHLRLGPASIGQWQNLLRVTIGERLATR